MNSSINFFLLIGVVNTFIHALLLIGFVEIFKLNVILSNTLAFFLANIFSYFANSYFTFKSKFSVKKYIKFISSSIVLLLLSNFIFLISEFFNIKYYYALTFNILVIPTFSYLIMRILIFKKETNE